MQRHLPFAGELVGAGVMAGRAVVQDARETDMAEVNGSAAVAVDHYAFFAEPVTFDFGRSRIVALRSVNRVSLAGIEAFQALSRYTSTVCRRLRYLVHEVGVGVRQATRIARESIDQ